ncbi:MAG: lysoplasmalogenase [Leucobacter sp.]|nr:lysoplasmalogenase [Leucobacter sp.]
MTDLERRRAILPFVPYIAVSLLHVGLLIADHPLGGYATKQLLMAALALAAVWLTWRLRPWPRGAMALLLIALAASWVGDGAGLIFPGLPTLPVMILFFGIAHAAYIVLFWRAPGIRARRVPRWVLVYAGWWIVTLAIIGPHAGALLVPLAIYGVVLGGTAALSPRFGPISAWGGAFFLISDTLIAVREFLPAPDWIDQLIMPTYALGQGLIVFAAVGLLRRRSVEADEAGHVGRGLEPRSE